MSEPKMAHSLENSECEVGAYTGKDSAVTFHVIPSRLRVGLELATYGLRETRLDLSLREAR